MHDLSTRRPRHTVQGPLLAILICALISGCGDSSADDGAPSADVLNRGTADTNGQSDAGDTAPTQPESDITAPDAPDSSTSVPDAEPLADTATSDDTAAPSIPDTSGGTGDDAGAPSNDTSISPSDSGSGGPAPDPSLPGPFTFTSVSGEVNVGEGAFGPELIGVDVLLPDADNRPIILFLPGAQLVATDYTSTREHLASMGFVVVFPAFFDGSLLDLPDAHTLMKENTRAILDWIDEQAAGAWSGTADSSRIAAIGHSLGGKLSFLVATEDERISAVAGIDPVDSGPPAFVPSDPVDYPSVAPELMSQITVPLLIMGETVNGSGSFQNCAPAEDNFQQYYAAAASPAMEVDFIGANHMSFLDDPAGCPACSFCPTGSDDPVVTKQVLRRLLTAFLAATLNADPTWNDWLIGSLHTSLVTDGLIQSATKNDFAEAL